MERQVSIAEARQHLPALVHEVETQGLLQLTRRGQPVAVLLSMQEYARLQGTRRPDLWEAIAGFRETQDLEVDPVRDSDFEGLRDRSPMRDFEWPL